MQDTPFKARRQVNIVAELQEGPGELGGAHGWHIALKWEAATANCLRGSMPRQYPGGFYETEPKKDMGPENL